MTTRPPIPRRARYLQTGFLAISPKAFGLEFEVSGVAPQAFEEVGGVAVVSIAGPLEQHPHWLWDDYESIRGRAEAAFASATARAVCLRINSPGGAAAGCFELARALRAMSEEAGKPLAVYVDGMAASAAYAIACSANAGIYAPPTASVGSLAVYEMLVDASAQDAACGLKFTFVPSSGADLKLAGNPHVPPSDAILQHTQGQVDLLTDLFYGLVEEMRGIPSADIRALRGAALLGSQGLDNRLVDHVSDWDGLLAALQNTEGTAVMGAQAKSKISYEECLAALTEMAGEGDDEGDVKEKAKKMLAALMSSEDEDKKPEEDKDGDKAKAEAEEKSKAQAATSTNEVSLAAQLQALRAEVAADKEARLRAELLATRPDFSAEIRKTLASAPVETLQQAVKSWPRVAASLQSTVSAAVPAVIPGKTDGATPGIRPEYLALLDRMGNRQSAAQARVEGTSLVLEPMSTEAATKRIREMREQGTAPKGAMDFERVSNTEFKVKQ